jgi:beta-phosphoglucomutase-like phosphatase (HAD superfamily)
VIDIDNSEAAAALTEKTATAIKAVAEMLATMRAANCDPRGMAVCRTQFETAFLWTANAVGGEPIFEVL